ncbi:hypothetical protein [Spongiactinospora rosea]|nr:hypothetical protein [Spongiactinospora rosea]
MKRAGLVAAALVAGLLTFPGTPNAFGGDCTHFGSPGYAQVYTDTTYGGDCFEWLNGHYNAALPSYVRYKVSSLRSWASKPGETVFLHSNRDGLTFQVVAGEAWAAVPGWFNDKADFAG